MVRRRDKSEEELLEVHVTEEQLELLGKLDFPGTRNLSTIMRQSFFAFTDSSQPLRLRA